MRLFFPVLLVILAFCILASGHEVNTGACPSALVAVKSFLMGSISELKSILEKYNPPEEALSSTLEAKECIDEISSEDRHHILHILIRIVSKCKS
nr:PREDICTED: secretoglobin family 1D member 2-like [Rhinolophus sinicus]